MEFEIRNDWLSGNFNEAAIPKQLPLEVSTKMSQRILRNQRISKCLQILRTDLYVHQIWLMLEQCEGQLGILQPRPWQSDFCRNQAALAEGFH